MITIKLKTTFTGVRAGVEFTDGVAKVATLAPNLRRYFDTIGAKITDPRKAPTKPTPAKEE